MREEARIFSKASANFRAVGTLKAFCALSNRDRCLKGASAFTIRQSRATPALKEFDLMRVQ